MRPADAKQLVKTPSGPWADFVLTLPIFIAYHLGVIFLPVRNAADVVTRELSALANNSLISYFGLTLGIGATFVAVVAVTGRGRSLRWERFAFIAAEGVLYAVAMRLVASYLVGRVFLAAAAVSPAVDDRLTGLVMSLGAGFYEEITFRVLLFGMGVKLLALLFPMSLPLKTTLIKIGWAVVAAGIFSGWHYVGDLGDPFDA
jgi:hypothetical protein